MITGSTAIACAFERWASRIESLSAHLLTPVPVSPAMLERTGQSAAYCPDRLSANGSCRLLRARDGWVALNLPRGEDLEMVPALLGAEPADAWPAIARHVATQRAASFVARAKLVGLAAARLDETRIDPRIADEAPLPTRVKWRGSRPPRVVDLSALWAGPLAGALLARAGCEVLKIDGRPAPDVFGATPRPGIGRLDDGKRILRLDLDDADGRRHLAELLDSADVVITGMRSRALAALGLRPVDWVRRRPALIWIAITAHGLSGAGADRVGFGDDCAVAGGLVHRYQDGAPAFLGDALADPLTGLRAASIAFAALAAARGGLCDVSLAGTAARVAAQGRPRRGAQAC